MTFRMPAETDPQERVWMAFPTAGYMLGETDAEAEEAFAAWSAVALAVAEFEPVTVLVDPSARTEARDRLGEAVELVEYPLDDAWMRDIGPTFVFDEHGAPAAVDWVFNGWGQQEWARWGRDQHVGAEVARLAGVSLVDSPLVNEGGGIHVDGLGTVLLTETVQLDPYRNPGHTKESVEAELARTIGASNPIWLPRGLTRDAQRFGTRGHVDILATIPEPGTLLVHAQRDPGHPDHRISHDIRERLEAARTPDGDPWRIVDLPAPEVLRDAEGWVDYSYVNHLVVNGAVIACSFADPVDAEAAAILAEAYPGRQVVGIDARAIFARGGGIHCITQQQPRRAAP
ncbi:agmatine deiminase family protein [Sciscionella sediminilitoris]|uniref:agmatine deiminase family protein n=1 Tax=Sciscionella sediminilitoris TaxID=1445613 RepID=UPI0004DFAB20|nr:agmatine deiminase family protein [Sciscionella sp. SE31]